MVDGGHAARFDEPARSVNDGSRQPLDLELMDTDIAFLSLADLSRLLATRKTSSREIVESFLARIAALDGRLHAYIDVYDNEARLLAKAADLERDAGVA